MVEDDRSIEIKEEGMKLEEGDDYYYEDEDVEVDGMTWKTMVARWIDVDGKSVKGMVVMTNNGRNSKSQIEPCPICSQPPATYGDHRICCLPCGHIYGMSCINMWLQRHKNSTKCPQCNSLSTLEDVRPLYSTRLFVADQTLHKGSTRYFPFTKEAFEEFKQYALQWRTDAVKLKIAVMLREGDVAQQCADIFGRVADVYTQMYDASNLRIAAVGETGHALQQRVLALKRLLNLLEQHADALEHRGLVLDRRAQLLGQQIDACAASILLFEKRYKGAYALPCSPVLNETNVREKKRKVEKE